MVNDEFLKSLPEGPGVYIMKSKDDTVIYVGKAKNLKNRVTQYFKRNSSHTAKVLAMVSNIDHLEYIVTNTETDALNLECSLIKKHRPKYNILLKDDKGYPFIEITDEKYPRLNLARRKENKNSTYFGPFISSFHAKQVISILCKIFKIRECKGDLSNLKSACLNYHINRCDAPCIGKITQEEYQQKIKEIVKVLSGNTEALIKELTIKMNNASENFDFENAAVLRDRIYGIKKMYESQLTVSTDDKDKDILCLVKDNNDVCIQLLQIKKGKLIDKKAFFMNNTIDDLNESIMEAFLLQYYSDFLVSKNIIVSDLPENVEQVAEFLSQLKGSKVLLTKPIRGDNVKLVEMARKNAIEAIANKKLLRKTKDNNDALEQFKHYLGLSKLPERIEAYDISNTAGAEIVASMVVFENGLPSKRQYRKFKIRSLSGQDDYGAMREVLTRRFTHQKKDESFNRLPDIIFVDGGKGQVNAAKSVLRELGIDIVVLGIVKDDRHKTRDIVTGKKEFNIPLGTKCFKLATEIQDEMHRVAISYHRLLRKKKNIESELMKVKGIGKKRYLALMSKFKTLENIKNATPQQISQIKGISLKEAERIVDNIKLLSFFE
ncbi:MAG: excinuclease ABC subunit UvrC [Clostridia bacterium]|nr:excinuclease ABC subunit UvrC [Clostridia bacterium]